MTEFSEKFENSGSKKDVDSYELQTFINKKDLSFYQEAARNQGLEVKVIANEGEEYPANPNAEEKIKKYFNQKSPIMYDDLSEFYVTTPKFDVGGITPKDHTYINISGYSNLINDFTDFFDEVAELAKNQQK